jgi:hypothetical protein
MAPFERALVVAGDETLAMVRLLIGRENLATLANSIGAEVDAEVVPELFQITQNLLCEGEGNSNRPLEIRKPFSGKLQPTPTSIQVQLGAAEGSSSRLHTGFRINSFALVQDIADIGMDVVNPLNSKSLTIAIPLPADSTDWKSQAVVPRPGRYAVIALTSFGQAFSAAELN